MLTGIITDPLMETKEYYYQIKKKAGEKIGTKRKEINIRCIGEGRRIKDIIKKSRTTGYYMIDPTV